jgi:hypothetical protein
MYQGNGDVFEDFYVYYNIFDGVGKIGYTWAANVTEWGSINGGTITYDNINFLNNVLYAGTSGTASSGFRFTFVGPVTNLTVRNNIIVGFPGYSVYGQNFTANTVSIENNIFYGNGLSNNNPYYYNCTLTNKTEQNNQKVDPLFVLFGTDFNIQSSSPAINAGLDVGLTADYVGNAIVGLPDIGAYEFIIGENHTPSIINQNFQIDKNSPNGTVVGTVVASDPDADQTLEYSIESGNTDGAFTINTSTGELSVANSAALNVDFTLVVKVQDNGIGELSSQATITINIIPTGIESKGNNSTIKVYPNPVSDELIIEVKENYDRQNFEVFNSIGQNILKGNLSERTVITTTNFSPGVYLIKLQDDRSIEFKKIVKV